MRSMDSRQLLGNVFVIFLKSLGAGHEGFPLKLQARCFQNAHRRLGDFRSDAVARNESDFVSHISEDTKSAEARQTVKTLLAMSRV